MATIENPQMMSDTEHSIECIRRLLAQYTIMPIVLANSIKIIRDYNNCDNDFYRNFEEAIETLFNTLNKDDKHMLLFAMTHIDNELANSWIHEKRNHVNINYVVQNKLNKMNYISYLNTQCPNETDMLNLCINMVWRGGCYDNALLEEILSDSVTAMNFVLACLNTNRYEVFESIMYNPEIQMRISYLKTDNLFRNAVIQNITTYTVTSNTLTVNEYEHNAPTDRFPMIYIVNKYFEFGLSNEDINNCVNFFSGNDPETSLLDNLIEHFDYNDYIIDGIGRNVKSLIKYIGLNYFSFVLFVTI